MAKKKTQFQSLTGALETLREERSRQGLSQEEMADKIEKSVSAYVRMENGYGNILTKTIQDSCQYLGLTPHLYFLKEGESINLTTLLEKVKELSEKVARLEERNEFLTRENELLRRLDAMQNK